MHKSLTALAVIPAAAVLMAAGTAQASASWQPGQASAVTLFSNVPDSGYNGNWATDRFAQADAVTLQRGSSSCPAGQPYEFAVTDYDLGISQTIIGASSPGETAVPIARSVPVVMAGGFTGITFCSSSADASGADVPQLVNGATAQGAVLAGEIGTEAWYARYFAPGTTLSNFSDPGWGWHYTLDQNPACGPGWQEWTDAYNVPQASSGNIVVLACAPRH